MSTTRPVRDLVVGDRIRGPVGRPFPTGIATVSKALTPANRGGQQVGYRIRLAQTDGREYAPWVAALNLEVELADPTPED